MAIEINQNRKPGETDYDWGYRLGFADVIIQYVEHHYSTEFCRGYKKGRNDIQVLIDEVVVSRMFD